MPTKVNKKLAQKKPVVRFYLAEDVRQELSGKMSVIGLYPDNVVILNLPDEVPDPTESSPIVIRSLALVFNVAKLASGAKISVDIEFNGKRKSLLMSADHPWPGVGKSVSLVGVMEPCPISGFGERQLIVTVGEEEFRFEFEIRRESIASIAAPVAQKTKNRPATEAPPALAKKRPKRTASAV